MRWDSVRDRVEMRRYLLALLSGSPIARGVASRCLAACPDVAEVTEDLESALGSLSGSAQLCAADVLLQLPGAEARVHAWAHETAVPMRAIAALHLPQAFGRSGVDDGDLRAMASDSDDLVRHWLERALEEAPNRTELIVVAAALPWSEPVTWTCHRCWTANRMAVMECGGCGGRPPRTVLTISSERGSSVRRRESILRRPD